MQQCSARWHAAPSNRCCARGPSCFAGTAPEAVSRHRSVGHKAGTVHSSLGSRLCPVGRATRMLGFVSCLLVVAATMLLPAALAGRLFILLLLLLRLPLLLQLDGV